MSEIERWEIAEPVETVESQARWPWRVLVRALLLSAVVAAISLGLVYLYNKAVPGNGMKAVVIWETAVQLAIFFILIRALRHYGISLRDVGFQRSKRSLWHLLWQLPIAIVSFMALTAYAVQVFAGGVNPQGTQDVISEVALNLPPVYFGLLAVSVAVLAPLWEELAFRGILFGLLKQRTGLWLAALISGAAFGAMHGYPAIALPLAYFGVCLALIRHWHDSLWASIITHAFNNGFVILVITLTVIYD